MAFEGQCGNVVRAWVNTAKESLKSGDLGDGGRGQWEIYECMEGSRKGCYCA